MRSFRKRFFHNNGMRDTQEAKMFFVALKMLTGDRAKYFGLIFAIAFSTFLLEQQSSIFAGILQRTTSQIIDVVDAQIWVMDPKTQYVEEIKALRDTELTRVRSVPGVAWAVPLYRGLPRAKSPDGTFRAVVMLGLDDATLVGAPRKVLMGTYTDLWQPDSVVIDRAEFFALFPGEPLQLGKSLELNDRLVHIVGIVEASAPFQTFPVMYARYSQALNFTGRERNQMSFVLVEPKPGMDASELCKAIEQQTALVAKTTSQFAWQTIHYYLTHTSIPVNFGITITIAIIVGTVVAGQTFYNLHPGKSQAIRGLKGHRRYQSPAHRDDPATGPDRGRHWVLDRVRHGRHVFRVFPAEDPHARHCLAVAELLWDGRGNLSGSGYRQPDQHPPGLGLRARSGV